MSIVDVFDALTAERPYEAALPACGALWAASEVLTLEVEHGNRLP